MVFSPVTVPSVETTIAATDVGYLVGNQILENQRQSPQWRYPSTNWFTSGTNATDNANFPTFGVGTRSANTRTRPGVAAAGQSSCVLLFDITPGTFDTVMIWNHNLNAVAGCQVEIRIANTSAGGDSTQVFTQSSVATNRRIGLQLGTRYSGVEYVAVRITSTGQFGTNTNYPTIGCVWLGRRRQFSYFPNLPWDDFATDSDYASHTSDGGNETRYTRFSGRKIYSIETESPGADTLGHNQNNELRSWWSECGYGARASIYNFRPASYGIEQAPVVLATNKDFTQAVEDGPFARVSAMEFAEVAPFVNSEG